jgi:hypothetical protein
MLQCKSRPLSARKTAADQAIPGPQKSSLLPLTIAEKSEQRSLLSKAKPNLPTQTDLMGGEWKEMKMV